MTPGKCHRAHVATFHSGDKGTADRLVALNSKLDKIDSKQYPLYRCRHICYNVLDSVRNELTERELVKNVPTLYTVTIM